MTTKGRPGGVLPINIAVTKPNKSSSTGFKTTPKNPTPRLRLLVRRLPPGLTVDEFWEALGDEWRVGAGKVDWAAFKPGKISKDPSKPSKPARAYLKVKDQSLIDVLSTRTKQIVFQDAKNTSKDICLTGPPSLELAPYNKVPSGRTRADARQGTIDQDQEFIDFLQSLTEPISKPAPEGLENVEIKSEKVTTTPLVQYIKDKKANKAKEAAQSKASKGKQESKDAKSAKKESKSAIIVRGNSANTDNTRVTKATQDAVKAINRSVASMQNKAAPTKIETKSTPKEASPHVPTTKRERERGNVSAAARMLQRDLGLAQKSPRNPRTPSSAAQNPTSKSENIQVKGDQKPLQEVKSTQSSNPTPPSGPRTDRAASSTVSKSSTPTASRQTKSTTQPSAGAKSAFLKHANPSQGVTEELLRTAFEVFGKMTKCEIDKKKGLGYVDFENSEGLRNAMQASPVKVGKSHVVVLENKSPYSKRSQASTQATTTSTKATDATATISTPSTPVIATASPITNSVQSSQVSESTSSSPTVVTANSTVPKTGTRGGNRGGRGNSQPGRSGTRGGSRGGRGNNNWNRGGRDASGASISTNSTATENQTPTKQTKEEGN